MTLYGKYVAAVSANHGLVAVNKELSNHERCRIEILEADVKVMNDQLAEANVMLDGLQGNIEPGIDWVPTCPECVNHRTALIGQRNLCGTARQSWQKIKEDLTKTLDRLEDRYRTIQMENGILRVKNSQTPCSFWKEAAYKSLEAEVNKQQVLAYQANARVNEYERDRENDRITLDILRRDLEAERAKLTEERVKVQRLERGLVPEKKRKVEEEEDRIDEQLARKLISIFKITQDHDMEMQEKDIYDVFIKSIPAKEHEQVLEAMYLTCHPGEAQLPLRERKMIPQLGKPDAPQVCKASLAGCLRAIGGVCKKVGSSNVWINVQPRN